MTNEESGSLPNRRRQTVAGSTGILFVVLFIAGIILSGNSPALNASTAKITTYYQNHHAQILLAELLISVASVLVLGFLAGLYADIREHSEHSEHSLLAPLILASGIATAALGMVSDLAGTLAALLATHHNLTDPSLTRALYDLNTGTHLEFLPLALLAATLSVAIFHGTISSRWVGWLSAATSILCLISAIIGSLSTTTNIPPVGLLGFFITVIAVSVNLLHRHAHPADSPITVS
jgi:hypothetical protein